MDEVLARIRERPPVEVSESSADVIRRGRDSSVIVLDASAAVDLLSDIGEQAEWVRERLSAIEEMHAPHLLDIEVGSAYEATSVARRDRWRARNARAGRSQGPPDHPVRTRPAHTADVGPPRADHLP